MAEESPKNIPAVYETETGKLVIQVDGVGETVWATQKQIADMFGVKLPTINEHIKNLVAEGEIDPEATIRKSRIVASEGGREVSREVLHLNLDAILAIGYRVSSTKATAFRKWATGQLKDIIVKGYAINEERIRKDAEAQKELFKIIRKIRLEEANHYKAVRDIFKASSSDYDGATKEARQFFAMAQDLFHYAVTERTAAQIKVERCKASLPFCGLTTTDGVDPSTDQAQIAKNYLTETEIEGLENLCLQWMLYAEGNAMRGKKMTMGELLHRIQQLLEFNGYPVMWTYPSDSNAKKAETHVKNEMAKYKALGSPQKKSFGK